MPLAIMGVVAAIGLFAAYRMTKTKPKTIDQEPTILNQTKD